jgi:hypothetical protein
MYKFFIKKSDVNVININIVVHVGSNTSRNWDNHIIVRHLYNEWSQYVAKHYCCAYFQTIIDLLNVLYIVI